MKTFEECQEECPWRIPRFKGEGSLCKGTESLCLEENCGMYKMLGDIVEKWIDAAIGGMKK